MELKRRQATSIVLLGVIGAEFGQDIGENKTTGETDPCKRKTVDGFGLGPNQNLARLTSTLNMIKRLLSVQLIAIDI